MLSIIISTYQPDFYKALKKNIAETCGVPYEIIKLENPGLMGICEAYNKGVSQTQYDFLLFVHEDVLFHTQNWGEKLISHLSQKNTGVIGVAGGIYVPKAPCGWNVSEKYTRRHNLQNTKEKGEPYLVSKNMVNERMEVYAVDGVFMAVTKEVYDTFKFDEKITGYHGYDLDFSLRITTKKKNYVVKNILIEHFSRGNITKPWVENNIKIKQKNINIPNQNTDAEVEEKVFLRFLNLFFKNYGISAKNIMLSLKFYPLSHIKLKNNLSILKSYYHYIYHRNSFNKRYDNQNN